MFKNIKREEGFTLVELLVVVVILVALAAIAVPIFLNQKAKADAAAAQSNISAVASVIANGLSTESGSVLYGVGENKIQYSNVSGDQSVLLGDASLYQSVPPAARVLVDMTTFVGSNWCVSQGGYKMSADDSKPVLGSC